jgi:hypothetical protein
MMTPQKALIRLYALWYRECLTPSNVSLLLAHVYACAEGR